MTEDNFTISVVYDLKNVINCTNNSCKGEFIDKIKSSLNAAKIKIKGIYPNKRAKKAAGKINQKIEPYLISFCLLDKNMMFSLD